MRPELQALEAKVRAGGDWPDLEEYGLRMVAAGASGAEAIGATKRYRMALFHGWKAADQAADATSAADQFMALLQSFTIPKE